VSAAAPDRAEVSRRRDTLDGDGRRAPVTVVGAGWSGLAAAVALRDRGLPVRLIDSAPQAGGRARGLAITLAGRTVRLDNGQHLMVGAYRDSLALARRVGMAHDALRRSPMRLVAADGLSLSAPPLPAPLHLAAGLIGARGLTWPDRWALLRCLGGLRLRGWPAPAPQTTVAQWLAAQRQPEALRRRFWVPLCVAMLNTPAPQACAATFVRVLRDTLGAPRGDSDFLLAAHSLDEVLPAPAIKHLQAHGAQVCLRTTARGLRMQPEGAGWSVDTGEGLLPASGVILAVPAPAQARLVAGLPGARAEAIAARLAGIDHEPIATLYLAWPADRPLPAPELCMLTENPARGAHGQWFFDRGEQQGLRLAAVVVSAAAEAAHAREALTEGIVAQLRAQLALPAPLDTRLVVERRATLRCTPDRPRVHAHAVDSLTLPWPGLWLAGEQAWPDYPGTLEAAVRSGRAAAAAAASHLAEH
jgi:squalene-associated FAD-dependent desaturase